MQVLDASTTPILHTSSHPPTHTGTTTAPSSATSSTCSPSSGRSEKLVCAPPPLRTRKRRAFCGACPWFDGGPHALPPSLNLTCSYTPPTLPPIPSHPTPARSHMVRQLTLPILTVTAFAAMVGAYNTAAAAGTAISVFGLASLGSFIPPAVLTAAWEPYSLVRGSCRAVGAGTDKLHHLAMCAHTHPWPLGRPRTHRRARTHARTCICIHTHTFTPSHTHDTLTPSNR